MSGICGCCSGRGAECEKDVFILEPDTIVFRKISDMGIKILSQFRQWSRSAAGVCSIGLLAGCLILVPLTILFSSNAVALTFLGGMVPGLIGIAITISFVQHSINQQAEKFAREAERKKIIRYDRLVQSVFVHYHASLIALTISQDERSHGNVRISSEFPFENLKDMYKASLLTNYGPLRPSIEFYFEQEEKLRDSLVRMSENIDFKYYPKLLEVIMSFLEISLGLDMRSAIRAEMITRHGNEPATKLDAVYIAEETKYKWCERFEKGELGANVMVPYVLLYKQLRGEIMIMEGYKAVIKEIVGDRN